MFMGKKNLLFSRVSDYFYLAAGPVIAATAAAVFYTPARITGGGATGIGTIFYYLFGFDQGVVMMCVNIPLILIGMKRKVQRVLPIMEHLVHAQRLTGKALLRNREHHHRPMLSSKVDGGVGRIQFLRERADEKGAAGLQISFYIEDIGINLAFRSNEEEGGAQVYPAQPAAVGLAEGIELREIALDLRRGKLLREKRGRKENAKDKREKQLVHYSESFKVLLMVR